MPSSLGSPSVNFEVSVNAARNASSMVGHMVVGVGREGDAGGRAPHAARAMAAPAVAAAARAHLRMRALYASRRRADVFLPRSHAARDDFTMRIRERRRRRSIDPCLALTYQLAACCKDGAI